MNARLIAAKMGCERDYLFFVRYFFKARFGAKFILNWHHHLIADKLQGVIDGRIKNLVINVPPGSGKTEEAVISFIPYGLTKNKRSRYLHLSYSDTLAELNSQGARDLIATEEFQALWPMQLAVDSKAKGRWNVMNGAKKSGGLYATSTGGQVTGFRAGHMVPGWQGAIIIDDPLKPEDAFSKTKLNAANRRLLSTIKSRRANPETPIIVIMQRIAEEDPTGFIKAGNMGGEWEHVVIPALLTPDYIAALGPKYQAMIDTSDADAGGRVSYWPYKEPLKDLLSMERGDGENAEGTKMSRAVFAGQYNQNPVAIGGNILKSADFGRYKFLPKIKHRKIFADTAQKTAERNDYSVFECWGYGEDKKAYLIDLIRGKWEAPELLNRARAFWGKHKAVGPIEEMGSLREMLIEDKASGTGLIQTLKSGVPIIPVKGIERNRDKLTRAMDFQPYLEAGMIMVPEDAPWLNDFLTEAEAFTSDDTHSHDDQLDPMFDAAQDFLSSQNKLNQWANLA